MALRIFTNDPGALLESLRKGIDQGSVDTWSYDADGDFTHTPDQWRDQAWLRPSVQEGTLSFGLIGRDNVPMTPALYAIYHARFTEMLLCHFDREFTAITTTAAGDAIDIFN